MPNPFSFLEDSLESLKRYLDGGAKDESVFFNQTFINELQKELVLLLSFCNELNKDQGFIRKINDLVDPDNNNTLLYKSEHFFLSDFIQIYERLIAKEDEKSRFALAYYYDVLRNDHFAEAKTIESLNQLVSGEQFIKHLIKIRNENNLWTSKKEETNYFLLDVLSESSPDHLHKVLAHYQFFIESAYALKFKHEKEVQEFFHIDPEKTQSDNDHVTSRLEGDSIEKVLEELNQLIGLEGVKKDVSEMINLLEIQTKRTVEGLKNAELSLHSVFLGPPGTGKTSVARLLSRIYKHLGFLSQGQSFETDREGLIAGYVGQTAIKMDKAVKESIGGVLFIDEAYSLTENSGNDFGREAVNTLLKRMEDHRNDLAVVVAGYTEPMKEFIDSNPGLRSRFSRYFYFDHFKPNELFSIFKTFCEKSDFIISEDAKEKLTDTFALLYEKKDESFGNARVVRNLFEKCVQNHANRVVKFPELSQVILKTLEESDVPEPKDTLKVVKTDF